MANIKFSGFTEVTNISGIQEIVGYNGTQNVRITPTNFVTSAGTGVFLPLAGGTMSGDLLFGDGVVAKFGNSQDLRIQSVGDQGYIQNYTGDLQIQNLADDKDLLFRSDDGAGGTETYFFLDGSLKLNRFLTDTLYNDNVEARFGTSTDLKIYHDGTNSAINNLTGDLYIMNASDDKDIFFQSDNGSGGLETYLSLDGSDRVVRPGRSFVFPDNISANFGAGYDLNIKHDGGNSYISQGGTGDLYIQQNVNDKDLVFQADDGSGGTATYLTLDGSTTNAYFSNPGNVGIGTTSPAAKLEVDGNIQATGTRSISASFDANHYMRLESNSSGGLLKGTDGGVITVLVRTYGDSYFNGGNFGIGTTTPTTWKLTVDSDDVYAASFDTSNNTGVTINGNNATAAQLLGYSNSASTYNDLDIRCNSTPGSGVYIDGSESKVGISTTAPSQKLHVSGNVRVTGAYYDSNNTAGTSGQVLSSTGGGTDWIDAAAGAANVTDTTSGINVTSPGTQNIFIGFEAGNLNSSNENVYIGYQAGEVSTGSDNTFIGNESGEGATTGSRNVAIGHEAGEAIGAGGNGVYIGWNAGSSNGGVSNNVSIGYQAAAGTDSVFIGYLAGSQVSVSSSVVAIGYSAARQGAETGNIAIGYETHYIGSNEYATAIGYKALRNLNEADEVWTTAVGYEAGFTATGSGNNSYFGHRAGYAVTTGAENTLVGAFAGDSLTTGSNNIVLGYNAAASSVSVSNEITLGNASITAIRAAVTSITSLSDERDKKDIKDITYGLGFINKLQPREFVWNNRIEQREFLPHSKKKESAELKEIVSANKGKKDFGFIAQEVQVHDDDTLRLIYDANPEKLEMSYGKLVPILVKAIQELSEKVTALENS